MNRCFARLQVGLDHFDVIDAPRGRAQSNWFELSTNGGESSGRVLMRAVDYKRMIDAYEGSAFDVVLVFGTTDSDQEKPEETVSITVTVAGAMPAVTSSNVDVDYDSDRSDTVEVFLFERNHFDERRGTVDRGYNVQVEGFTLAPNLKPNFRTGPAFTVDASSSTSLLGTLGYSSGEPSSFVSPPVEIRNVQMLGLPKSRLTSVVFGGLGLVADTRRKKYYNRGQLSAYNQSLMTSMSRRVGEKRAAKTADSRYPAQIDVAFTEVGPGSVPGDVYTVRRSLTRGSSTVIPEVHVGHWLAYHTSGSPDNPSELSSIATWFATGKGNALDVQDYYGTYQFAGIVNLELDGAVRGILWCFNANDVSTTASYNQSMPMRVESEESVIYGSSLPTLTSRSISGHVLFLDSSPLSASFPAMIMSSQVVETDKRWRYTVQAATVTDNVTTIVWTQSGPAYTAYNGAEATNDANPIYGVGFEPSTGGVTLKRKPIKNGVVVMAFRDSNGILVFSTPNGYKVTC